jgi:hypothetical protein
VGSTAWGSGTRRRFALCAAAALVVALVGTWAWGRWSNSTTPLSIDDVVEEVGSSAAAGLTSIADPTTTSADLSPASSSAGTSPPPVVTVPAVSPGVYRYLTKGQEGIDALSKPVRAYPAESAVVVSSSGCGMRVEWRPLEERREWFEICSERGGWRLVQYGSFHSFFGTDDERSVICPDDAWLVAPGSEPGDAGVATCTGSGLVDVRTSTFRRRDVATVDGAQVEVVVVDVAVVTSGATTGTSTRELWLAPDGLPVVWSDEVSGASESVVGMVNYDERFTLRVASLDAA